MSKLLAALNMPTCSLTKSTFLLKGSAPVAANAGVRAGSMRNPPAERVVLQASPSMVPPAPHSGKPGQRWSVASSQWSVDSGQHRKLTTEN